MDALLILIDIARRPGGRPRATSASTSARAVATPLRLERPAGRRRSPVPDRDLDAREPPDAVSRAPELAGRPALLGGGGSRGPARDGPRRRAAPDPPGVRRGRRGPPADRRPRRVRQGRDLGADGRYALHAHQDPAAPTSSSSVDARRSSTASSATRRRRVARSGSTTASCSTSRIEQVLLGERPDADAWPPRLPRQPGAALHASEAASSNTTTWRAACPARSRSKASSRSASGRRRSISRSIGSLPCEEPLGVAREVDRRDRGPVVRAEDPAPAVHEREALERHASRRTACSRRAPPSRRAAAHAIAWADRRGQPDRLEHEVRPAVARRLRIAATVARRVGRVREDRVRSRPSSPGERELGRVRVHRDDPPRAREHRAHHARQPDAAEPDDGDGRGRRHRGGLDHRADARRHAAADQRRHLAAGRRRASARPPSPARPASSPSSRSRGRRGPASRPRRVSRRRAVGLRVAERRRAEHSHWRPRWHSRQARHGRVPAQRDRRRPTTHGVACRARRPPRSRRRPRGPARSGRAAAQSPSRTWRSEWQTPDAVIRTRTSPARGSSRRSVSIPGRRRPPPR